MPSHQERREPLPTNYQFGDGKPQTPKDVVLTEAAYTALLEMMLHEEVRTYRLTATKLILKARAFDDVICIADMRFTKER